MSHFETLESHFNGLEQLPEDPIFGLNKAFIADPGTQKINLGVGSYKNALEKTILLNSVKKAEEMIFHQSLIRDYLPIIGDPQYIALTKELVFGADHPALREGRIVGCQSLGGTGALRTGSELLFRLKKKRVFLSTPTWPNHMQIFVSAGLEVDYYPYYNEKTKCLDFNRMIDAILHMPEDSIIVLQASCHNPTGIDPTFEQWDRLSDAIKTKRLIPFFDMAYQGLGEGIEQDAEIVRHFAERNHEMFVAVSYSKNFGLYGERTGFLGVVTTDLKCVPKIESNLQRLIRSNYSNPPTHGAKIVTTILSSPELTLEWKAELNQMRERIKQMRSSLVSELQSRVSTGFFNFMTHQKGMFSYSGLNQDQVHRLKSECGIYMPSNGRINVAGLNSKNMNYVVDAIISVLES